MLSGFTLLPLPSQHLPEGYPRDFPLPTACTSLFSVDVVYVGHETTVRLHVDPLTVQLPSMVSMTRFHSVHCLHSIILPVLIPNCFVCVCSPFHLVVTLPMNWGMLPAAELISTVMGSQSLCVKREWSTPGSCSCWSAGLQEPSPVNRYRETNSISTLGH